ncbi:uncharacterized protein LOC113853247 [Abrus precatorius]|uniref:Uncharacterized protein LOC113853247 n=1 Tax=Abrus precatorius TaxID=3816 RepID=A0A8B8K797_ABRPR|nr:uncharacterized protein LOC113853247 [Abrus precatorius]
MAAPVAIGTRGTIGSLVRKEIEYFTKFELDRRGSSKKPQQHFVDVDMLSGRSYSMSRPSFWVLLTTWKRRKRRGTSGSGFLPKICSVAEVAETNQLSRIPGYSYQILKNDINTFHL